MPEIEGIGQAADPDHRPDAEQTHRTEGACALATENDGRRTEHGDQGRGARPRRPGGLREQPDRDHSEAAPRDGGCNRGAQARPYGRADGDERADAQLPQPGGGDEMRAGRVGRSEMDGPGEGGNHDCGEADGQGRADRQPAGADEQSQQEQQDRPDDVELLLHRQAPEVLNRRGGGVLGEVVDGPGGQAPVDDIGRGRGDIPAEVAPTDLRQESPGQQGGGDQDRGRGREESFGAAGVEPDERDASGALDLTGDLPGDQEARDHEKDVDTGEAAR